MYSPQLSNSFHGDPTKKNTGDRVYEKWKGSNKFFLGGRLIFGPDVRSLLVTLLLIIGPVVIFCVFVGRHLMYDYPNRSGVAIVVVVVVHTSAVLCFLLMTSGRDPGIIPRNAHPPEPEEENSPSDWSGGQTPKLRLPRTKDVLVNGVTVKTKYCDTCMLYRPPRCSHCSICNNCVERFDHHCPWVGQCIGKRNYRYFFLFVLSTTLLCFLVFTTSALRIKNLMHGDPPHTVWKALQRSPASAFLMGYAFLATWFVGGLTTFHIYLISTNQTTYENFRYRYDNKVNPYNMGVLKNFKSVLCSRIEPSKNNFRAKLQTEVQNVAPTTIQSRDSIEILSPNRKAVDDLEMGDKSAWTSMVGGEAYQEIHSRNSSNGTGLKTGKQGFEEAFAEALGKPLPQDTRDIRSSVNARRSSWGRNYEISSDIFSAGNGAEGSRGDATRPQGTAPNR